jgi:hypothetical protein
MQIRHFHAEILVSLVDAAGFGVFKLVFFVTANTGEPITQSVVTKTTRARIEDRNSGADAKIRR